MTTHAEIIAAVAKAGHFGATADDVASALRVPINDVTGTLTLLYNRGVIGRQKRARISAYGKPVNVYYPPGATPAPPKPAPTVSIAGSSGPWPTGECRVVMRNGIKVTIGPSATYDRRHQVDPKSRPVGAGFAAVGLGRDVQTGRQWEPAR